MRISGITKKNWEAAYGVVREACAEGNVNESQVKVIAHAAIETMHREKSPDLKKWKGKIGVSKQAKQKLQERVKDLIVSDSQPWHPTMKPQGVIQPYIMRILQ